MIIISISPQSLYLRKNALLIVQEVVHAFTPIKCGVFCSDEMHGYLQAAGVGASSTCVEPGDGFIASVVNYARLFENQAKGLSCLVAVEDFAALVAARILGVPSIFIGNWLPQEGRVSAESLAFADFVVVTNYPGFMPLLKSLRGVPYFVGPLSHIRGAGGAACRSSALRSVEQRKANVIALVLPENIDIAIIDLIVAAYIETNLEGKCLVIYAGSADGSLNARFKGLKGVTICNHELESDQRMHDVDLVINLGVYGVLSDLAVLGIPVIFIATGIYPLEEFLASHSASTQVLNIRAIDSVILARHIESWMESGAFVIRAREKLMVNAMSLRDSLGDIVKSLSISLPLSGAVKSV